MRLTLRSCGFLALWVAAAISCGNGEREAPDPNPANPGPRGLAAGPSTPKVRAVPISGGTLLVAKDGSMLVADPDRDRLRLVAPDEHVGEETVLEEGAQPGRAIEDDDGRFHVVLRGADEIATVSNVGQLISRTGVCHGPRGIAFDSARSSLYVACLDGGLWTLDAHDLTVTRKLALDPDLRDVVSVGDKLLVSTFRSAEVLTLDSDGNLLSRSGASRGAAQFEAAVAWRMIPWPGVGALMVHQNARKNSVEISNPDVPTQAYLSADCSEAPVTANLTAFSAEGVSLTAEGAGLLGLLALPVDVAIDPTGEFFVMIAAGSDALIESTLDSAVASSSCFLLGSSGLTQEPIAVAYRGADVVVQLRQPSRLMVYTRAGETRKINLAGKDVIDAGHSAFHRSPSGKLGISCASCHPEGRDDGHTWVFDDVGPRRSQSLLGGVLDSKPFHWDGSLADFDALMVDISEKRMGNPHIESEALANWVQGLPALKPPSEPDSEFELPSAGRLAFERAGCDSCHAGPKLTSAGTFDVGTGGKFVVPSLLGVRYRSPLMHNGCAPTLSDRFTASCGGDAHGDFEALSGREQSELLGYLESL